MRLIRIERGAQYGFKVTRDFDLLLPVAHATTRWQTAVSFSFGIADFDKQPVNRSSQLGNTIEEQGNELIWPIGVKVESPMGSTNYG